MGARFAAALAVLCCAAGGAASTAAASGVRIVVPDCNHFCESDVEFTALPGERNLVSASFRGGPPGGEFDTVVVSDAGAPLTPGKGCHGIDAHTAECEIYENTPPGIATFRLFDRKDRLDASLLGTRVFARGGSGDDELIGGDYQDDLEGDGGRDLLDGRAENDVARYPERSRHLRVDLAAKEPQGAPWSRDTLINIDSAYAPNARGAVLLGDAGPNRLWAGRGGRVAGRAGDDTLTVDAGGRVYGGPGADTIGDDVDNFDLNVPLRPARAVDCGSDRDLVFDSGLADLVSPNCERINPDTGSLNEFIKLYEHPRRKHAIAIMSYGCEIEEGCPLAFLGRLGSPRGTVIAGRRRYIRYERRYTVYHHYALRLNARGRSLLRRRGRIKVAVSYQEGPYPTPPRYTPREGFTMIVRR